MPVIDGPVGPLHHVVTGSDDPTTLFVPGLAQSIADTRPFGSAVAGTRVFVDLRGHGGSRAPESYDGWTYGGLAADARTVAGALGATRALGVSLGAGALLRLIADEPGRFDRVVLALPGPADAEPDAELLAVTDDLADAVEANDPIAIGAALVRMQPEAARGRSDVRLWARRHAAELGGGAVSGALRHLPRQQVLPSLDALSAVTASVLVLAQRGDAVHPVSAAEALMAAIPLARLEVSDTPWVWGRRSALRETVSAFLNQA
ncbi:MAG: alpha/beta hydrolase [Actinomycetia bacterium]|nr:alpha/beta hydrolase [Actinomycetes bacterium]